MSKCGGEVELRSLYKKFWQKQCSSFARNTYLFNETVVEFTDMIAWKMAEVEDKPDLRSNDLQEKPITASDL